MRKKLIALLGAGLLLTGCTASPNNTALSACVDEAETEIGASIDAGDLNTANMGDALYEAGITDERDTDDANALFTVSGDFTYTKNDKERRKTMVCTVKFVDGTVDETSLNIT